MIAEIGFRGTEHRLVAWRESAVLECRHLSRSLPSGGPIVVEVTIDSIRVSLMSQHRVVILKDTVEDRYLPIWIGPYEAEAITVSLQQMEVSRPLTHDLLRNVLHKLGAEVQQVLINDLRDDVFYARILLRVNGRDMEIDSRPSDALALAVRVHVPVFVEEAVMEQAATKPEESVDTEESADTAEAAEGDPGRLEVFKDFMNTLDLEELDEDEGEDEGDDGDENG
jgi:bifunctional DNase/RNase